MLSQDLRFALIILCRGDNYSSCGPTAYGFGNLMAVFKVKMLSCFILFENEYLRVACHSLSCTVL